MPGQPFSVSIPRIASDTADRVRYADRGKRNQNMLKLGHLTLFLLNRNLQNSIISIELVRREIRGKIFELIDGFGKNEGSCSLKTVTENREQ